MADSSKSGCLLLSLRVDWGCEALWDAQRPLGRVAIAGSQTIEPNFQAILPFAR
jgi:hypothetical protein